MASDVADSDLLKRNTIHLLLKYPQGIKSGDFAGAFYKLHGHHPQLASHGYSSLKYLLDDMKDMVVVEKNSQETVIKLADGSLNHWFDGEGWVSSGRENAFVLIREVVGAYPFGLKLKKLKEILKAKHGFDLEKFRTSQGYKDALSCLQDIPGFLIPQCQKVESCVIQLQSDAFVLIREVVGAYPFGLKLKKLKEILKGKHGFDLEKFRTSQGYKDALSCLQDIPGLLVPQCQKAKNCVIQLQSEPCNPAVSLDTDFSVCNSVPQKMREKKSESQIPTSLDTAAAWRLPGKKPVLAAALGCIVSILGDYPEGLHLQKLMENLKKRGFDWERFSQDMGYGGAVDCLLEMPGLHLTFRNGRISSDCVVQLLSSHHSLPALPLSARSLDKPLSSGAVGTKPASSSSTAPQASASLSCDSAPPARKSETVKQNVPGKKPAVSEVLAALTDLLKTYATGLRVEKVQEFLLASKGLDLAKFSIAQGYKDTLEFLEHKMPKLKIKYKANRLKCVVMQGNGKKKSQDSQKEMKKGKEESPSLPHSDIPAQQSRACQLGRQSEVRELPCPTDSQLLSTSSTSPCSEHLDELKQQVAHILSRHPEGMSLFQFRAAYSATYQHHLPLGNASSAKQRLLEMSDIVCMKGCGVQTLLLPVSPAEPPTKSGPRISSKVENGAIHPADSLPKASVSPVPAVVLKPSVLETWMEPPPCSIRPLASDQLRTPNVKENCILPKEQCQTAPKRAALLQESVRPKSSSGGHLASSKAEEPAVNLGNSLPRTAVIPPQAYPSQTAAAPVPQLHASVPSTSSPGNQESSFLPESHLPKPPKPLVLVEKDARARALPGDNVWSHHSPVVFSGWARAVPGDNVRRHHSPVVFSAEPQVGNVHGNCISGGFASRDTHLVHPSFSVNIPVPSLFQPVLTNIIARPQPVVYSSPIHLPNTPANPSHRLASVQLVSRPQVQPVSQNRPARMAPPSRQLTSPSQSVEWARAADGLDQLQSASRAQSRLARVTPSSHQLTSPSQTVERTTCARAADGLDQLQSASGTQAQSHSPAPAFCAGGRPVSLPSVKPPGLQSQKSPSLQELENVHHAWPNTMASTLVPVAGNGQQPACSARAKSDALPLKPLASTPQSHHLPVNSARTSSATQPAALSLSPSCSPSSETNQPAYDSFRSGTGNDASCQSMTFPGMSSQGGDEHSHSFTLPNNQRNHFREEPTQPSALQNSPAAKSSNNCVLL
ncbi:uncharacterized protein LOC125445258 isoform X2 [Sphaerodactylus townsendi]|uniref:uncharacterized protein LOC125445258 isoform X2 n=1 Tax=Sphaerodactylus townsendi TaxID=933632 RepID=UPI0020271AC5|nr:uncharacterized protein LOC125445258 isoform X2 [Sphaerodactylus townsendi]